MSTQFASLAQISVLRSRDLEWLQSVGQIKQFSAGTHLIEAGQVPRLIYLCLSGCYGAGLSDGNQFDTLLTLTAGDLLGETALLEQRPASLTVQVTESAEVLVIPRETILSQLIHNQDFAGYFYHLIAVKLSQRLRALSSIMAKRQIKEGEPLRKVLMLFATLNDSDVSWMVANGVSKRTNLGEALIQEGQSVPAIYLLLDGTLGIYIASGGQDIEVAKRVKGDILGEMSFVDGGNASATVRTLENAWVMALPQPLLAAKLQEDRGFASRFYRAIAQTLSTRCQDLLVRSNHSNRSTESINLLSEDIEVEDEIDFDVLEGTAIAGTRFDWLIHQVGR
jgi:bacteriocin-type transport-associated protein